MESTVSTSFACDLGKWHQIMQAYENGGHAYHATMPSDALTRFRDVMKETNECGLAQARSDQQELGDKVRALLARKGFKSVAAEGFQAPGVIVSYTDDKGLQTGKKFAEVGLQIAPGVPMLCDEPEDFQTFRIGLFGLDKLQNIDSTIATLDEALSRIL
jgi:aspartate aminotransferase-like enzyme